MLVHDFRSRVFDCVGPVSDPGLAQAALAISRHWGQFVVLSLLWCFWADSSPLYDFVWVLDEACLNNCFDQRSMLWSQSGCATNAKEDSTRLFGTRARGPHVTLNFDVDKYKKLPTYITRSIFRTYADIFIYLLCLCFYCLAFSPPMSRLQGLYAQPATESPPYQVRPIVIQRTHERLE